MPIERSDRVVLKKLIHDPFDAVDEMLEGFALVVDALVASMLGSAGPARTDSGQSDEAGS